MGRSVSCARCGAWGEIPPEQSGRDWLCPTCRAKPAGPEPQGASGQIGAPDAAGVAVGRDSGAIGSAGFASAATSLEGQLREMREAVQDITIGTADVQEAAERLSQYPVPSAPPVIGAEPPQADSLVELARHTAAEEGRRALETAEDFIRRQAGEVVDGAEQLVREKGVGAARDIGDFSRGEARRIGREARTAAEHQVKDAAARAAEAARGKLDQAGRKVRRAVKRAAPRRAADRADRCAVCDDRIVQGDRTVTCPNCNAVYHAECYELTGGCVSEQCRRQRGQQPASPQPGRVAAPAPSAAPDRGASSARRCLACGAKVSDKALVCPHCGRWMHSKTRPGTRRQDTPNELARIGPGCVVAIIIAAFVFFMMIARL